MEAEKERVIRWSDREKEEEVGAEQGRLHGYLSRVRLGRGSNESLKASKQQNTRLKIR